MIWAILILVVLVGLIAVLNAIFPGVLGQTDNQMSLTHKILLLMLVSSSVVIGYRGRTKAAFKHSLAWAGIALALILAYSFKDDASAIADRVVGQLLPSRPLINAAGEVELRASRNGHFHADARIEGVSLRLLVDTGATTIALAPDDAERIGFDLATLDYNQAIDTANGRIYAARVTLRDVDIGGIQARNVLATVHRDGLAQSLLGMSFLDRLTGFERRGSRLILKP